MDLVYSFSPPEGSSNSHDVALDISGRGFGLSHPASSGVAAGSSDVQMSWDDILDVSGNVVVKRAKSKIDGYGLVVKEPIGKIGLYIGQYYLSSNSVLVLSSV